MDERRGRTVTYRDGDVELRGYAVPPADAGGPRPGVLVFPTWKGLEEFGRGEAEAIARLGYVGFGADLYGAVAADDEEAAALMGALLEDRSRLRQRARCALDALAALPEVDAGRLAAIGFCFGGLCALDLARSGADVKGTVTFHGFFRTPEPVGPGDVLGRVLALHGNDDPLLEEGEVDAFRREMTDAGVDWELVVYGGAAHGFTNPKANAPERGVLYHPEVARRARARMEAFLREVLEPA